MSTIPTFDYTPADQSRERPPRAALIGARQKHPTKSIEASMMMRHYEAALQFLHQLESGKAGETIEERAGALAVVLTGTVDQVGDATELILLRHRVASARAGFESIRDACEIAEDVSAPVTIMRNAVALARGRALRELRTLDGGSADTSGTAGERSGG